MNRRNIQTGYSHQMSGDGFVAGGDYYHPIPGDHPTMDLHQITNNLPGGKDIIHTAVEHRPSVADIRAVKLGWLSPFLKDSEGSLLRQLIQVDTTRVTAAEHIFYQNLRFAQIFFIPPSSTTKGIHLNPISPNLPTFLLPGIEHKIPPEDWLTLPH
jgi:hypothetical protein